MNHSTPIANPIMKTWNSGSQPWLPNRPPMDSLNCKSVGYRLMAKTGKQGHNSGSYIKIYIISLCIIYKNIYNIYIIYIPYIYGIGPKILKKNCFQDIRLESTMETDPWMKGNKWVGPTMTPVYCHKRVSWQREKTQAKSDCWTLCELMYCCWESSKSGSSS